MVDILVSQVVQRLGDFLIAEVGFSRGIKSNVRWLKDELRWMQRFLNDAECKQFDDYMIRLWVDDMREIAYDIEDAIDIYHYKVQKRSRGIISLCRYPFDKCKETTSLYKVGEEIEEFKNRINDLSRRRQQYGLQDIGASGNGRINTSSNLRELRRSTSYSLDQENVVGFDDDVQQLLAKLLEDNLHRSVISIYGMGGLGKTTIAGKLYHNNDVRKRFRYFAWVSVSQDYTLRDLLLRIIKSFTFKTIKTEDIEKMNEEDKTEDIEKKNEEDKTKDIEKKNEEDKTEDIEKMNVEDLQRFLLGLLQRHSYLVVIDDVWDKQAWECLKRAFPDKNNGSRVIITTRNKEVAESSDERTYAHELRFLTPDESWQLFFKKASKSFVKHKELETLGKEMADNCQGLPLAIVVLAGLLSRKKPQEWHMVRDELGQQLLKADPSKVSSILALSFESLPYQLKPCFLYLGLFPEDHEIDVKTLIQLWIAEGFIPQDEDHIMEEVAKDFLNELIGRSLIQVGTRRWHIIETCRVHDLLRDLAIGRAKDLKFLCICDEVKNHSDTSPVMSSCPRQAIYSLTKESLWIQKSSSRMRSLFLFDKSDGESKIRSDQLIVMSKKFCSLRVLYVDYSIPGEENMAKKIGKLIHLKYLQLSVRRYIDLSFIYNLTRLQTLYVSRVGNFKLHDNISRLQELRHLIGDFECYNSRAAEAIGNLTKLQTLSHLGCQWWAEIKTEKLVNLRELWLHGFLEGGKSFSFDSMANLKRLRILSVELVDGSFSSLQPLSHCRNLKDLRLWGMMSEKLPEDIDQVLPKLESLFLRESELEDDPMPLLEKLPNLIVLSLGWRVYNGEKMKCSARGFLRLELLMFYHTDLMEKHQELQVEEGAFPMLRNLVIHSKLSIPQRFTLIPPPPPNSIPRFAGF